MISVVSEIQSFVFGSGQGWSASTPTSQSQVNVKKFAPRKVGSTSSKLRSYDLGAAPKDNTIKKVENF